MSATGFLCCGVAMAGGWSLFTCESCGRVIRNVHPPAPGWRRLRETQTPRAVRPPTALQDVFTLFGGTSLAMTARQVAAAVGRELPGVHKAINALYHSGAIEGAGMGGDPGDWARPKLWRAIRCL